VKPFFEILCNCIRNGGKVGFKPIYFSIIWSVIYKTDNQFAVNFFNCLKFRALRRFFIKHKLALFCVGFLVIVLFCSCINKTEMYLFTVVNKSIVTKVFCGLYIILVSIRPVKFYLITLIRNCVNAFFVAAFRNKITFIIITAEKFIKC